jgi:hypothetical protein
MSLRIIKDTIQKVDIDEKTKTEIVNMCKEIFSDKQLNWDISETGAEILCICKEHEILYFVRFLTPQIIEFGCNYYDLKSTTKTLDGLKNGLKEMVLIKKSHIDFCNRIF